MLKVNSASSPRLVILQLSMLPDAAVASDHTTGWTAGGSERFFFAEELSDWPSDTLNLLFHEYWGRGLFARE